MNIQIFDAVGVELQTGDTVMIQEKRNEGLTFYAKVQLLDGALWPFNKFAYDRIVKVDTLPADVKHIPAKEKTPEYWMHPRTELHMIEKNALDKWRLDVLTFENNNFYKLSL